jgi:hypothetical protein
MPGYLDRYGQGEERREKILKTIALTATCLAVAGGILFFIFHNYRQEQQVRRFFDLLASHDYKGAYALWGCTDAKPCSGYSFPNFLQDWGPGSADGQGARSYRISRSRSCGSGVILTVNLGSNRQEKLWVERNDLVIGFSPFPGCPAPPR